MEQSNEKMESEARTILKAIDFPVQFIGEYVDFALQANDDLIMYDEDLHLFFYIGDDAVNIVWSDIDFEGFVGGKEVGFDSVCGGSGQTFYLTAEENARENWKDYAKEFIVQNLDKGCIPEETKVLYSEAFNSDYKEHEQQVQDLLRQTLKDSIMYESLKKSGYNDLAEKLRKRYK